MSDVIIYIRAVDVDAYTNQGWCTWRLHGHHGARKGMGMKTYMAWIRI